MLGCDCLGQAWDEVLEVLERAKTCFGAGHRSSALRGRLDLHRAVADRDLASLERGVEGLIRAERHKGEVPPLPRAGVLGCVHVQDGTEDRHLLSDRLRRRIGTERAQMHLLDTALRQGVLCHHDGDSLATELVRASEQLLLRGCIRHRHVGEAPGGASVLVLHDGCRQHLAKLAEVHVQLLVAHGIRQHRKEVVNAGVRDCLHGPADS
mmetsp:Transcript_32751/g.83477  ORF Transcript_32751/g.83477 Transcript_32751/m.83477 type:complete len:209 (-) Transcript_32751:54-680(-)